MSLANGVVTTLAGSPALVIGRADGAGTLASFNAPADVAVDSAGLFAIVVRSLLCRLWGHPLRHALMGGAVVVTALFYMRGLRNESMCFPYVAPVLFFHTVLLF